ncbi:MAG: hypothetical protein NZL95_08825 [Chitinophagales bacterium]|nr:hypothetical protein [Chitinophagales bacterium]MDW8428639.1 hypothetical protein [Chitinophagales bacterium]
MNAELCTIIDFDACVAAATTVAKATITACINNLACLRSFQEKMQAMPFLWSASLQGIFLLTAFAQ